MIDQSPLDSCVLRAVGDLSAGYGGVMVSLGMTLGLYQALAGAGPISPQALAARTGGAERSVREWLNAQAAGGDVGYHASRATDELSPAQAMGLADDDSPVFIPHAWQVPASRWFDADKAIAAFRTGKGVAWGAHDGRLSGGVAAFDRQADRGRLVSAWLPALDGVVERLEAGRAVADVGCGHGHATVLMAEAFPRSRLHGGDAHAASIEAARRHAAEAGLAARVTCAVARAADSPGQPYGLICFFDCRHDLGDPVAAARHAAEVLAPDGTVMLVEPFAHDRVEDNRSPVARLYDAASTPLGWAHALAEGGRLVLGAQAGEARLAEVLRKAGCTRLRRAAETPLNLILDARR